MKKEARENEAFGEERQEEEKQAEGDGEEEEGVKFIRGRLDLDRGK